MDPVSTAVTAFLNAVQATQATQAATPGQPVNPQAVLSAFLGQDLNLIFQGLNAAGLQFSMPSGQTVTAQGSFPYPEGTQLLVRVLGTADGNGVRLQTLQALPPAPAAILAPLLQGEAQALQNRLTLPDPPPELEPLVQLFRLLGGASFQEPAEAAPSAQPSVPVQSQAPAADPAEGSTANPAQPSLPSPAPAATTSPAVPAGSDPSRSDPSRSDPSRSDPLPDTSAPRSDPKADPQSDPKPDPQADPLPDLRTTSQAPLQTPGQASSQAPSSGTPAVVPSRPDPGVPTAHDPAPAQAPTGGSAETSPTSQSPAAAPSGPDGPAPKDAPQPQSPVLQAPSPSPAPSPSQALPASTLSVVQTLIRNLPEPLAQSVRNLVRPDGAALDPGTLSEALSHLQSAMARRPDLPQGDGNALIQLLRILVKAPDPGVQRLFQAASSPAAQTSPAAAPESWESWIKAGVKALADPAVSPREAPFHAAQAKEGTGLYELPLPWAPHSTLQIWTESDGHGKGKGSQDGASTRVLMGMSFSRLGETRLGLAKGQGVLQVRVWAQHPESLVKAQKDMEEDLKELGTPFDLKILPLEPGPGGVIPSIRSLATGSTFQVLG